MTTTDAVATRVRAYSIPLAERSLAPDIARGFMLLFIALANVPEYLWGRTLDANGMISGSSELSRFLHGFILLGVEHRSRPMFAILYGFGLAMIASRFMTRAEAAGRDPRAARKSARRLLARRSLWLMAFGVLHSALLFFGDILFAYGITGLVALGFVVASKRAIKIGLWTSAAVALLTSLPLLGISAGIADDPGTMMPVPNGETWPESAFVGGVIMPLVIALISTVGMVFVPLVLVGVLLYRAGWITKPEDHLRALRLTAGLGLAVGVLSALPLLGIRMGWWQAGTVLQGLAGYLDIVGGTAAGLGYICGFALVAHALRSFGRRGPVRAVAALGQRSLTGYLLQSIICAPLLSAWGLNLAHERGYGFAFAWAVGTWLITLMVTLALDVAGKRGPFEVLLRKLSYR